MFFIPVNCLYSSRFVHKETNVFYHLTVQSSGRNTEVKCLFRLEIIIIIRAVVVQSKADQPSWYSVIS